MFWPGWAVDPIARISRRAANVPKRARRLTTSSPRPTRPWEASDASLPVLENPGKAVAHCFRSPHLSAWDKIASFLRIFPGPIGRIPAGSDLPMSHRNRFCRRTAGRSRPDTVTDPTAITTAEGCPAPMGWVAGPRGVSRAKQRHGLLKFTGDHFHGRTMGTGRPIYFLNGLTGTSDLFCLMVWLLRDEFRCVVFDYPTHADGSRQLLTNETLASGLFAAADRHGDDAFSIFATSFGSVVALTALAAGRIGSSARYCKRGLPIEN